MKARWIVLAVLFALLALFAVVNWSAFVAPTRLNLLVATVEAPLGLLMLAVAVVMAVVFLVYVAIQQAGAIAEARRYAKELQAQRELADQAEASRFTELRGWIEQQLAQRQQRIDVLESALNTRINETGNSLAAALGEIEDKLDRVLARS